MLPGCEVIVHRCHATLVLRCVYIYNNDCCECCCAGVVMFCPFECFKKNNKKNDIRRGRGLAGRRMCMQQCMFGDCAGCCAVHSRLLLLSGRSVRFFFFSSSCSNLLNICWDQWSFNPCLFSLLTQLSFGLLRLWE